MQTTRTALKTIKLDMIRYDGIAGWLKIDDRSWWIDTKAGRIPQLWVHVKPGTDAVMYFSGSALGEGTAEENHEFAVSMIRERIKRDAH